MVGDKRHCWPPQPDQAGGDACFLVALFRMRRAGHMGQLLDLLPQGSQQVWMRLAGIMTAITSLGKPVQTCSLGLICVG